MANGQANFTNVDTTTYGSFVPINCDTGYEASGGSEAECLASGSWSTDVTCVVIGLFTLSIIISACFLFIKRQLLICHTYEHSCEGGHSNGYTLVAYGSCFVKCQNNL